ncbi:MAG: M20/M25/M40 family metallo-hydrolase, partial [Arenicella sp.]|nr:M20/M25/M40 family metallo-hydrolase [Arenicella sp.]
AYCTLIAALMLTLAACGEPPQTEPAASPEQPAAVSLTPSAELMRTHMATLADDNMQGREAGTAGYDKAAAYVAEELRKLGVLPGGDNGSYFQDVPLRRSYRDAEKVKLEVTHADGSPLALTASADYLVRGSLKSMQSDITAEVVFAGYGLVAPELGRNDYQGLDVEGKLVALLGRTPSGIQSEERAYYGSLKAREASKRGAVGIVSLYTPTSEKIYSFERLATEGRLDEADMGWIEDDGQVYSKAPNLEVSAVLSITGAEKLFAGAPVSWPDIVAAAEAEGGVTPTFELPLSMTIQQASRMDDTRSANVLGVIPGSDPMLKNEVLVLSAHLDGLGISNTDEEDRINNGALDNAAGIATLLEAARMLMQLERPKRSVAFLANTAEEKGLLGTQYFVKHPTLGELKMVGNINLDMPVLTYDFQDVVVFGGDRSTLRGAIQAAAADMGVAIAEDPFPEQGIFTRSDHFRFVEDGIPAVMLATGMANGGEQAWAEHFAKNYHRPSDDMNNNINFDAAAKFAELKTRITLQVANAEQRPLWNKGDFFARQFDGPMRSE